MTAKFIGSGYPNEGSKYYTTTQADSLLSAKAASSHTHAGYQTASDNLTALSGLTSAANKLPYFTGTGTASTTDITSLARTLLGNSSTSTMQSTLGLVIGTNVQAYDADLQAIGALSGTSGFLKKTGANTWSLDTSTYLTSSSTLTASNLSGTIPSGVLGASNVYIGTTAVALNRGSGSLTLNGVDISGNAATVTNGVYTNAANSLSKFSAVPLTITNATTSFSVSSIQHQYYAPGVETINTSGPHGLSVGMYVTVGSYSGTVGSIRSSSAFDVYTAGVAWSGGTGTAYNPTARLLVVEDNTASTAAYIDASGKIYGESLSLYGGIYAPSSGDSYIFGADGNGYIGLEVRNVNGRVYLEATANANTTTTASNVVINSTTGLLYRYASSSQRYKNNIAPVSDPELEPNKILDIEVVEFNYNDGYMDELDNRHGKKVIGFIAEDVYEKYPIAADLNEDGLPENWNDRYLVPAMLKVIQDQQATIEDLKARLDAAGI